MKTKKIIKAMQDVADEIDRKVLNDLLRDGTPLNSQMWVAMAKAKMEKIKTDKTLEENHDFFWMPSKRMK